MKINPERILENASEQSIQRGRTYYRRGRVTLLEVTPTSAKAGVQGTRMYIVRLSGSGRAVAATCTCPYSGHGECKHIVAVMFALMARESTTLPMPLTERLAGSSSRTPSWAKSLARVLESPETAEAKIAEPLNWRLAFSIQLQHSDTVVVPLRIPKRKDGTDGRPLLLRQLTGADRIRMSTRERMVLVRVFPEFRTRIHSTPENRSSQSFYWHDGLDWHDLMVSMQQMEVYWREGNNPIHHRLTIDPAPGHIKFSLLESGTDLTLLPEIQWGDTVVPVSDDLRVLTWQPLWVVAGDVIRYIEGHTGKDLAGLKDLKNPITIPARDRERFIRNALPTILGRFGVITSSLDLQVEQSAPVSRLYLHEASGRLEAELRFGYGGTEIPAFPPPRDEAEVRGAGSELRLVRRNPEHERHASLLLEQSGLVSTSDADSPSLFTPADHPMDWLIEKLPGLRVADFEVYGQELLKRFNVRTGAPKMALEIQSGIDWFDLDVDITFEGTPASLEEFISAVHDGRRYVKLTDGSFGVVPDEWMRRFRLAASLGSEDGNILRLSRSHISILDELSDVADVHADAEVEAQIARLRSFEGIGNRALPEGFTGTLRPYQQAGYDWLRFLQEFGLGGILADDMGLGKTIQTLALLLHLHNRHDAPPSLVIVPTSVVPNWSIESARFTPGLRVLTYHGMTRRQHHPDLESHDVIITSYGILRRDIELLKHINFTCIVLDESQNIKNYASVNARAARSLKSNLRLALTGTPVENNLSELWSQVQFTNPGLLGGIATFTEMFMRPIEREHDEQTAASLRKVIKPFLLRRTKELVATELPPKVESIVMVEMEPGQRAAYQHWREYFRRSILKSIDEVGVRRSAIKVLAGLTRLRLVCCHPVLADPKYSSGSGKLQAFLDMLDDVLAEGHKILVFSQFVRMLTILRAELDRKRIHYQYLDGRTINRQERIDKFQSGTGGDVFLISLKAGGTGLNLTSADYVIHYDPWWNPAVEAQATDRTHRIGQTKQVFSYKLITRETVEEKILALQEQKTALVKSVIHTEQGILKSLTRTDIEELFS
jgi:non-specific serine/threonine protein kinase